MNPRDVLPLLPLLLLGACATPAPDAGAPVYAGMTDRDVELANRTLDRALETLPSGEAASWNNPANGHSGSVRPVKTAFVAARNTFCRDYEEVLTIGGRTGRYRDTACRDARGTWLPAE